MTRMLSIPRSILLGGILFAAVMLAAGLPDDASAESRDTTKDIFVPAIIGHTPIAIWSDGDTIWGPDMVNDNMYAYDLDTKQRDKSKEFRTLYSSGNNSPTGVWSDGDTMWVADIVDVKLYAYDMSTKARDSSRTLTRWRRPATTGRVAYGPTVPPCGW